jgi:hypothetical protein
MRKSSHLAIEGGRLSANKVAQVLWQTRVGTSKLEKASSPMCRYRWSETHLLTATSLEQIDALEQEIKTYTIAVRAGVNNLPRLYLIVVDALC